MQLTRLAGTALGALALGATVLAATPATSSATTLRTEHRALSFVPIHLGHHASGKLDGFNIDGGNWSGYATTGSGFRTVSASWVEPNVTCNSRNDLFAPWVGIDGYGTNTVEQTGVATDCSSGSPEFAAWYEMYPAAPVYYSNPVAAGDHISAKVTRSGTSYTLKITDHTRGWSRTVTKSLSARNATAEFILESPTAAYPNFHSVHFTGAKIDGSALGSYDPDALDASNRGGFEDHTGAITNGTAFSVKYLRE